MQLGKIIGTVVSTHKDRKLAGLKLQLVRFLNLDLTPAGGFVVAVDGVGAGEGEVVLVASGSSARLTPDTEGKPVDAVIMAIVDELEIEGRQRYRKGFDD